MASRNTNLDNLRVMLGSVQDLTDQYEARNKQSKDQQFQLQKAQQEHQLKEQGAKNRLQDVLGVLKSGELPEGAGINVGPEGAGISRQPNLGVYDLKKQQMDQKQANEYSKRLEKYSDVFQAAQEIERATNHDGRGGVFTNPNAQLQSAGKIQSAIPDSMLGLGEMVGAVDKGTAEERKAIARFKLALGHSLTGARMNPAMQKAIADSLGQMTSGDPQLMSKGLRGSARILGGTIKTVQGGFSPEVRGTVHSTMGGDPMEFLGMIPPEQAPPSNYVSPPAGTVHKSKQPKMTPAQTPPAGMSEQPPQDALSSFNPDAYLKGGQ